MPRLWYSWTLNSISSPNNRTHVENIQFSVKAVFSIIFTSVFSLCCWNVSSYSTKQLFIKYNKNAKFTIDKWIVEWSFRIVFKLDYMQFLIEYKTEDFECEIFIDDNVYFLFLIFMYELTLLVVLGFLFKSKSQISCQALRVTSWSHKAHIKMVTSLGNTKIVDP